MATAADYYLLIDGNEAGPFSLEQLRVMVRNGEIPPTTLAACDGWKDWIELQHVLNVHGPMFSRMMGDLGKPVGGDGKYALGMFIGLLIFGAALLYFQTGAWWEWGMVQDFMVKKAAKQAVLDRLRAPRSAVFAEINIKEIDGARFRVSLSVDAQNSFGAMIRNWFEVELQEERGGAWYSCNKIWRTDRLGHEVIDKDRAD